MAGLSQLVADDAPEGIPLTGPQRDFLASYAHENIVVITDVDDEGAVHVWADTDVPPDYRDLWIPREGFIGQPHVELHDPEVLIDGLPEVEQRNPPYDWQKEGDAE